ncbi:hypothetical protein PanWU01x14_136290, partial [Parasponia andersonii]
MWSCTPYEIVQEVPKLDSKDSLPKKSNADCPRNESISSDFTLVSASASVVAGSHLSQNKISS